VGWSFTISPPLFEGHEVKAEYSPLPSFPLLNDRGCFLRSSHLPVTASLPLSLVSTARCFYQSFSSSPFPLSLFSSPSTAEANNGILSLSFPPPPFLPLFIGIRELGSDLLLNLFRDLWKTPRGALGLRSLPPSF